MPRETRARSRDGASTKAAPISLSQEEVDALAIGAPAAKAVGRRLPPSRPPAIGEARTRKAHPAAISRSELLILRRGGGSATLRVRIESNRELDEPEALEYTTLKAAPTEPPATPGTRRG